MNEPTFTQWSAKDSLDYPFDWTGWLAAISDSIATYELTVPAGLVKTADTRDGGVVIPWLKVARPGYLYQVDCTITTTSSPPRTRTKSIFIDARR